MTKNILKNNDIDLIVSALARVKCPKIDVINDHPVFAVTQGWQKQILCEESGVASVSSPTELETALEDQNIASIYVPDETFGMKMLTRILERHDTQKPIFWETFDDE